MIEESVDAAVFGFLCVLDGVRSFSDDPDEIVFLEIAKEGGRQRELLNDFNDEFLHDRYQRLKA